MSDVLNAVYYVLEKLVSFLFDIEFMSVSVGYILIAAGIFGFVITAVLVTAGMGARSSVNAGIRGVVSGAKKK